MKTITILLQDPKYDKKVILEKLVCHALSIKKEQLFIDMDREINEEQANRIDTAYKEYTINKKPLEYIIGHVAFLGVAFKVTPATLIPRPETEYMIEAINEHLQENSGKEISLMDIGTGCGVLGLSVLLHNIGAIKVAYLTDLSDEALDIAKKNYTIYKDSIGGLIPRFLKANLLDNPFLKESLTYNQYILIANLPYIPDQLFADNPDPMVKKREPKMAFVGGDDGLDLYRVMFDQLIEVTRASLIREGDRSDKVGMVEGLGSLDAQITLFLEMMTRQVDILRQEYENSFTFEEVKTFHFNIRILKVTLT